MPHPSPNRIPPAPRIALIVLLLAASVLYLLTLDDGLRISELQGGDLITHQYAQVQARPSNAPGYPLYTMGGWLWFHLGRLILGSDSNPIRILSSYSTFWALIALALLYVVLLKTTHGNWLLALLISVFYTVTYFFWYYAVTTEQYTSAVAHTLTFVGLAWLWHERSEERYLLGLALLMGIGLAHMVTVLFIVPPLLWFVLAREPELLRRPRFIAKVIGMVLLPLVSYAYVYIQGAQHPEWWGAGQWRNTWDWFWHFLSTQQGRDELTWALGPFTDEFPRLIWGELTVPVLVIGLLGILLLGRRRAVLLYGTLIIYFLFCYVDRYGNWYQVIMPAYPIVLIGLAAALDRAWRWQRWTPLLLGLTMLFLIGYRFALSYPRADCSQRPEDDGLRPGLAILADQPAAGAAVLGTYDELVSLRYLTEIWGLRPDVIAVGAPEARKLIENSQKRPLYVTTTATPILFQEVTSDAHLSSAGLTLIRVQVRPSVG
ncbi:MAG TPA: DUF2723 domain-containing protein, partial [Anaerolineae bacterium]|nr:DUF2723 domain-containing protein [Anaerolineae bacterium]